MKPEDFFDTTTALLETPVLLKSREMKSHRDESNSFARENIKEIFAIELMILRRARSVSNDLTGPNKNQFIFEHMTVAALSLGV